jgi:hypothetical protein
VRFKLRSGVTGTPMPFARFTRQIAATGLASGAGGWVDKLDEFLKGVVRRVALVTAGACSIGDQYPSLVHDVQLVFVND